MIQVQETPVNLPLSLSEAEDLISNGQLEEAAIIYDHLCHSLPNEASFFHVLGLVRLSQGAMPQAISAYERAVAIDPNHDTWWSNLGLAHLKSGALLKAASCFRKSISLNPRNTVDLVNLGITLRINRNFVKSTEALRQALHLDPFQGEAIAELYAVLQQTCQWDQLESIRKLLDQMTQSALDRGETPEESPMLNIRRSSDLSLNQSLARSWSRRITNRAFRSTATAFTHQPYPKQKGRINLGYLSHDFRDHPVSHQLLPLFRFHDRSHFKVTAFSIGPPDNSYYGRGIRDACDEFIDIHSDVISRAAQTINDHHVDILIDLMGHTQYNRMEILALRPAPVQVGYLGFLATSGADFIDYVVADSIVVPESDSRFYSEKIIRLPHCYQMNHSPVLDGEIVSNRADWRLPQDRFVFCCFNKSYKIDRAVFSAWIEILRQVPESVLWLYHDNASAENSLRADARKYGIDPQRLIFGEKCKLVDHLDRLRLADLALDTVCYNGGATTSNALQAGVPVLTLLGDHWVSRMSASHLKALELDELVAEDLESYIHTAVDLANSPFRLQCVRSKLRQNIITHPLFDTLGFVRDLEKAYSCIYQRFSNGTPTDHVCVSELR